MELVADGDAATGVALNGSALAEHGSVGAFHAADSGWINAGPNLILSKSPPLPVAVSKTFVFSLQRTAASTSVNFVCDNGDTSAGQSIFVVGNTDLNPEEDASKTPI